MNNEKEDRKLYDLKTIYAISDNNPQFLKKLLLVFTDNVSRDVEALNNAAKAGDWPEAGQIAHKMKPSLLHFQITSVKEHILELEHQTNSDPNHLNSLVVKINNVINDALTALKAEFPNVFV